MKPNREHGARLTRTWVLAWASTLLWVGSGCTYDDSGLSGLGGGGGQSLATGSGGLGPSTPASGGQGVSSGGHGVEGGATGGASTGGAAVGGIGATRGAAGRAGASERGGGKGDDASTGGTSVGGASSGSGASGGIVGPVMLSVDFVGGVNASGAVADAPGGIVVTPSPTMDPSEMAGVARGAHWNSALGAVGTLPALVLSDGNPTNARVTWSSPPSTTKTGVWRLNFTASDGDTKMMNGYLDPAASPAQVVVTNLPSAIAARGYDVYVYCLGDVTTASQTRTYDYTIGTRTITASQTGPITTVFTGYALVASSNDSGNYVVFHNVSGPAFTLTAIPGSGSSSRAPVNGMQIVSPSGP
jgi:hypothetical protein